MRYIIIGGSGFVGTHTAQALHIAIQQGRIERGAIIVLDCVENPLLRAYTSYVFCDLAQGFSFALESSDIVIHLAARAYAPKPPLKPFAPHSLREYFFSINTQGTQAIVEAILHAQARKMIFFSTDMVYGMPMYLPINSAHPTNPLGYYGASKLQAEEVIKQACIKGLQASIFRPRLIVGAGRFGILTKLFALIAHHLPVPLIGNGTNCYQMISVQDCANAIICAITHHVPNGIYNLGSQHPPTIRALLSSLIKQAHSYSILLPTHAKSVQCALAMLEYLGVPLMYKEQFIIANKQYIVDISSSIKELDWHPQYSDSDMLLAAYKEYMATNSKS